MALFLLFSVIDCFEWFWIWSLHKNTQLMLEFLQALILVLHFSSYIIFIMHFSLYINDLPDDVICNVANYGDDTTLYSKCDQASELWQQLELSFELESDLQGTGLGQEVACSFQCCKNSTRFVWRSIGAILVLLMWKWMGLFRRKNHLLRYLGNLDRGSYLSSIAKTAFEKVGALTRSMTFLSPEVALYLYHAAMHGVLLSHLGWCP